MLTFPSLFGTLPYIFNDLKDGDHYLYRFLTIVAILASILVSNKKFRDYLIYYKKIVLFVVKVNHSWLHDFSTII